METAAKPGDERFFTRTGPHSLAAIAALLGVHTAAGDVLMDVLIEGVAPLQSAGPLDVSFLDNKRYAPLLADTKAGAVILHPDFADKVPPGCIALATPEPYVGWAKVSALFFPFPEPRAGIHPSAVIDPSAQVDLAPASARWLISGRASSSAPIAASTPRSPSPTPSLATASPSIPVPASARTGSGSPSPKPVSPPCRSLAAC
jgi:UDP-3-O-[3-hydroxymyristoyl] glucosamine N-acyltransferase